jgi:hypothetical protein
MDDEKGGESRTVPLPPQRERLGEGNPDEPKNLFSGQWEREG